MTSPLLSQKPKFRSQQTKQKSEILKYYTSGSVVKTPSQFLAQVQQTKLGGRKKAKMGRKKSAHNFSMTDEGCRSKGSLQLNPSSVKARGHQSSILKGITDAMASRQEGKGLKNGETVKAD